MSKSKIVSFNVFPHNITQYSVYTLHISHSFDTHISLSPTHYIECKKMSVNSFSIHTVLVHFGMKLCSFEKQFIFLFFRNCFIHKCSHKFLSLYCQTANSFCPPLEIQACHWGLISKGMSSIRIYVVGNLQRQLDECIWAYLSETKIKVCLLSTIVCDFTES